MMDERVLNKRVSGVPADAVYVGRPSVWGNRFVVGRDGSRAEVIEQYERWLATRPHLVERAKRELRGKRLVCWCAPLACHAEVLVRVANEEEEGKG